MGSFPCSATPLWKLKYLDHEVVSTKYGRQYPWKRCECGNPLAYAQVCRCESTHECSACLYAWRQASMQIQPFIILPKSTGCFILFRTRFYLSSSILLGVFSHDKIYLHIIYIYRFASCPRAKDIFLPVVSLLFPSLLFPPFFYTSITYDYIFLWPISSFTFPLPCESLCLSVFCKQSLSTEAAPFLLHQFCF